MKERHKYILLGAVLCIIAHCILFALIGMLAGCSQQTPLNAAEQDSTQRHTFSFRDTNRTTLSYRDDAIYIGTDWFSLGPKTEQLDYGDDWAPRYCFYWENIGRLIITNAGGTIIFPPNVSFEDEEGQRWHAEWVKD